MTLFAGLLDERVAVAESCIDDQCPDLFAEEAAYVKGAIERRRREFAAGRACARRAIVALGELAVPLPAAADRVPLWPQHLVGSITHTGTRCAAAVARRHDGFRSVGIDIEPAEPLATDLWEAVLTPPELHWLENQDSNERGVLARALFCIKECAFKCQYGVSRAMLEFADFEATIDRASQTFSARLLRDAAPFPRGYVVNGRLACSHGFLVSAATLM